MAEPSANEALRVARNPHGPVKSLESHGRQVVSSLAALGGTVPSKENSISSPNEFCKFREPFYIEGLTCCFSLNFLFL